MNVSVYLGSSLECKEEYNQLAFELGRRLALSGHTVVYGGANVGTMKSLADGADSAKGRIIGVFPRYFQGTEEIVKQGIEVMRDNLAEMILVEDFAERKKVMEKTSDCCVIMPGSLGTMDELFTYACNRAIGQHSKNIYVLNHNGYYTPIKDFLANAMEAGFLKENTGDIITFYNSIDELPLW